MPELFHWPAQMSDLLLIMLMVDLLPCRSHAQEGVRSPRVADSMCLKCPPVGLHDSLAALLYRCALSV